jgi:predicted ribonuclease YlaK
MYHIILSIVTVEELDNLKTSKDSDKAFKARRAIRKIAEYESSIYFDLARYIDNAFSYGDNKFNSNDDIIVTCADRNCASIISEDFNLQIKAKAIGVPVLKICKSVDKYTGFKEFTFTDEDFADFYSNLSDNKYSLLINEYIILKDMSGDVKDVRKWNGETHVEVFNKRISTEFFGKNIKPKDCYQRIAIDSIFSNDMTAISGKQGSGKSYLSLVCAMKLVETGKFEKITILFNPTKARGAVDMGYYAGDAMEKALQNSIGNMLSSKFVDEQVVLDLIKDGKIKLVSMADARGMEINEGEILYITEAQNTSVDLMKLCLSRAAEGCKVIVEGDFVNQVDNFCFENDGNGMKRAISKLKNHDLFGYVELQNIYRSRLANLVDTL